MFRRRKCRGVKNCQCRRKLVDRLKYFDQELEGFCLASDEEKIDILMTTTPCFSRLIYEMGQTLLKGHTSLIHDQYLALRPHQQMLIYFCKPSLCLEKRKKFWDERVAWPKIVPIFLTGLVGFVSQVLARLTVQG
jgi:hypothetical protein